MRSPQDPDTKRTDVPSVIDWGHWLQKLDGVTLADRYRLKNWLRKIKNSGQDPSKPFQKWQQSFEQARELKSWRLEQVHRPPFDQSLPIFEHVEAVAQAIQNHQVVIVCGETGSGKSTQLPLIALQAGYAIDGMIGHTQPRRIAARSIATRIASQMKTAVGEQVGYKIRFQDQTHPRTHIKLMTDGMLLAETQTDRLLNQYSLIIVDEAHERSLNIDFLLGNLQRILQRRPELRLVITSATIDTQRFAEHFSNAEGEPAPIFNIEGRTYPVEIRYEPLLDQDPESVVEPLDWLVEQTAEMLRSESGDLLVFLPTEQDIRLTHKKLRGEISRRIGSQNIDVLPLYARLSTENQNAIFNPGRNRRVVLATNVAESSVTVPRISAVIDLGTARISRYSPRNKVQRLPIEPVSQASANQRAGRCGRIGPGVCVRLYSEEDFESRPAYTTPEIRRTNLASVILQAKVLKLGEIETFPFIDPPRADAIRDGYKTLHEIGATDSFNELTPIGRQMGRLPVDPRIGRMILAADQNGCLAEILIIASALEIQDPRLRPAEFQKQADEQHLKFANESSDFLSLLKIWDFFHQLRNDLSRSKLQKACRQNFLSYSLLRQWQQLHHQLKTIAGDNGLKPGVRKDDEAVIHQSLLTGLFSGIAMLSDRFEYTGAGGIKFRIWPGSNVFGSKPKWVVAAEVVETSQRYGRTVARINPGWIEPLAKHLTKSSYSQPHWSLKRETVLAHEKVSLFGLPIVASRRTPYGKIDPQKSRELFIEQGLVEGHVRTVLPFLRHNRTILEQLASLVAKTRNRDFVVDPYQVAAFYEQNIPEDVFDIASLKARLKEQPDLNRQLQFSIDRFLPADVSDSDGPVESESVSTTLAASFPDQIELNTLELPVEYVYAPGDEQDGANIIVPKLALGQIDDGATPWLIPGLIETRVLSLIRSLPKSVRRNLVPAPDTARKVAEQISATSAGDFHGVVARLLSQIGQVEIDPTMFRQHKVDEFLKPNIRVAGDQGEIIGQGRSVSELREQLEVDRQTVVPTSELESPTEWQGHGLKSWDWDEMPQSLTLHRAGVAIPVFPALVDEGDSISLKLMDNEPAAEQASRMGLLRLYQILNRKNIKSQVNWLPELERSAVLASGLLTTAELKSQLADLITRIGFVENLPLCRNKSEFNERQSEAAERISMATAEVARWLPRLFQCYHDARLALNELPARYEPTSRDMVTQIEALTTPGFIHHTPWEWLQHYPRYFEAIHFRIEKRPAITDAKENEHLNVLSRLWKQFSEQASAHQRQGIVDPELERFRWMIEELRVSFFAQQIGTRITVSEKRIEKQWKKVRIAI